MAQLLRIDLTSRTSSPEAVPPDMVREYIGAKGIGGRYLSDEVGPDVDPLGPQNKMIFAVGPAAGTKMFGANRYALYFASPLTGGYGECYSGGNVAPQIAGTGYQFVIIEGKADAPVWLEISEDGVKVNPADDLWGLDAFEAEAKLLAKVDHPKAQASVIGPAGEKLVRFACINNNKWHQIARGGPGAVMGSKNVKGIVWHGDKKVEAARPDKLKELIKDLATRGKDDPGVTAYRQLGTIMMVRILNGVNAFPTRYWQKGFYEEFEGLTAEHMREHHLVKNEVCPPCIMQCVKHNEVREGPYKGLELDGPDYETVYCFGGLCQIPDFAQVMRMNDICDRVGIDTMCGGNMAALAIELCEQGKLDLGLTYGDADGVADFLWKMGRREGEVADLFADGILKVEEELGLKGMAVHVKGMAPAGYDPRSLKGMGLGYLTSTRGACHLRATFYKAELAGFIEPAATEGKAEMLIDWEDRLCQMDNVIYCRFYRDMVQWPYITAVVNALVGTDHTTDDLRAISNRIISEAHRFNEQRGFTAATHERLPSCLTDRPTDDEKALRVTQDEMDFMLRDYYRLRGWGEPAL